MLFRSKKSHEGEAEIEGVTKSTEYGLGVAFLTENRNNSVRAELQVHVHAGYHLSIRRTPVDVRVICQMTVDGRNDQEQSLPELQ